MVHCPICLKTEYPTKQDILCSHCHKDKLEAIRNSCVESDSINAENRQDINRVFSISESIIEGNPPESGIYSTQSMASIKQLSLQLLKRELINRTIKLRNIDKSRESLQQKVIHLNEQIVEQEQEIKDGTAKIKKTRAEMIDKFQKHIYETAAETSETKYEKVMHIEKQALHIQHENFRVLKEAAFSIRGSSRYSRKPKMLLFNQPILKISELFELHNKLFQLNAFFENLIWLQRHLCRILDFEMPYLDELVEYLPDTAFYDLVQQKENFMINGGEIDPKDNEDVKMVEVDDLLPTESEKIVKLGNTIKLPLSSKTINNHLRRASMVKASRETLQLPEPLQEKPSPDRRPLLRSTLTGKKVVIVPHKILTKPLTKLTSKEYLKFLLVIVKIVVNFKVLFASTVEKVPRNYSISTTLANLRSGDDSDDCNFDQMVEKVLQLDQYFEHKLASLDQRTISKKSSNISISSNSSSILQNSTTSDVSKSSGSMAQTSVASLIRSDEWKLKINNNRNRFKDIYKHIFRETTEKKESQKDPNVIYGNVSETKERHRQQPLGIEDQTSESELKSIMLLVHKLMADSTKKGKGVLVIAQSTAKLDDWDVVSKMYE